MDDDWIYTTILRNHHMALCSFFLGGKQWETTQYIVKSIGESSFFPWYIPLSDTPTLPQVTASWKTGFSNTQPVRMCFNKQAFSFMVPSSFWYMDVYSMFTVIFGVNAGNITGMDQDVHICLRTTWNFVSYTYQLASIPCEMMFSPPMIQIWKYTGRP